MPSMSIFSRVKSFSAKHMQALIMFALVCVIAMGSVLTAILSTTFNKQTNTDYNVETVVSVDYEQLVIKYQEYFTQNENGTISINLNTKYTRQAIDKEDQKSLQKYAHSLDVINNLVENGVLYIADDGNYYVSNEQEQKRVENRDALSDAILEAVKKVLAQYLNMGKNDFYVKTTKILWINVPTGYYLALNNYFAQFFAIATQIVADASSSMFASGLNFQVYLESILGSQLLSEPFWITLIKELGCEGVRDVFQKLYNGDYGWVNILLNSGILGNVLKVVIGILGGYINNQVGKPFKNKAQENRNNGNNTVEMNSDLLLLFPSIVGKKF